MASKISCDSTLNDYFEAMSLQDDEEETWKEYTDLLLSQIEHLTSYFGNRSSIPIDIRAFGSSVERLRIISPENIGDIDVMIFSLADEARITETIMEYAIPGNPIFVRLRGKDHPLLRHCLAENSDFVASAALKNFHPKIFGNAGRCFVDLLPKTFQKMQDIPLYDVKCSVQKKTGPSIQLDFCKPRESLQDNVAEMKKLKQFKFDEGMLGFAEWMVISMNPGKPFTEEHSATIDEYSKIVEEELNGLSENPSVENYRRVLEEIPRGPKVMELRAKVQEIDKKVAEKQKDNSARVEEETGVAVNQESEMKLETGKMVDTGAKQVEESNERNCDNVLEGFTDTQRDSSTVFSEGSVSEEEGSSTGKEEDIEGKDETTKSAPLKEGQDKETDIAKMTEKKLIEYCIKNILKMDDSFKSSHDFQEYLQFAAENNQPKQKGGMDIVPAFLAKGWPSVAKAWITRDRLWPNQEVISNILEYGFHLVVKSPNESERPDLDFRLSFSYAEYVLSQQLSDIQRQCYRCLKLFLLTITRDIKPKVLPTYFVKTILFFAVEETGMEFWDSENRGTCVMMLLRKLLKALEAKHLPHYFIPEFNLLKDVAKDYPKEIEFLAEEVRKICENPMSYPNASSEESYSSNATSNPISEGQKKQHSTIPASTSSAQQQQPTGHDATSYYLPRYQDFQVQYREVYREMLDLALKDGSVDTEDPIVESIVSNIRKVMSKLGDNPKQEMETVFESCMKGNYTSHIIHKGHSIKHKIRSFLKGQCELLAYVVRQEDILAPGNEDLIANRVVNSATDGSSDPFDLSVLYPLESDVLGNIIHMMQAQFDPKMTKSTDEVDDIPLD